MNLICGVLDSDYEYTKRLTDYMRESGDTGCVGFTSPEELREYVKDKQLDIILADSEYDLKAELGGNCKIITLTGSKGGEGVYKYQSADAILEIVRQTGNQVTVKGEKKITAFFSLGNGSYRSMAAFSHACRCGGNTLYVGLDEFWPFENIHGLKAKYDVSDVYLSFPDPDIKKFVMPCENIDVLVPPRTGWDTGYMEEDVLEALCGLFKESEYDSVILDVGTYIRQWYKLPFYVDKSVFILGDEREEEMRFDMFVRFITGSIGKCNGLQSIRYKALVDAGYEI